MTSLINATQFLSIIIPTKDRPDFLAKCIKSILAQTNLPEEVIIVDGSTENDIEKMLIELLPKQYSDLFKYIKSKPSVNFQRNLGISKSKGELITLLDDDVVLNKDYLYYVKDFFKNNSDIKVGALSTKILDTQMSSYQEHFSITELIGKIFLLWHLKDGRFQLSGIPTLISPNCNELKKVDFIFGGNATYPRHILEEYRFDENMPAGYILDDDDIAFNISRVYQNYWTPQATIHHKSHYIKNNRYEKSKSFIINYWYLRRKNLPPKFKYTLAACWATLGKFVLELYFSIKNNNLTGLKGTFSGLINVWRNKLIKDKNVGINV